MAFLVEDGTGVTLANAYITVAYFKTHHGDRGRSVNDKLSVIEGAIIRATDYIDKRYGRSFLGYREIKAQGLQWPRLDAYDNGGWKLDDVPAQLQKATAEYARIAINVAVLAPNAPNVNVPENLDGTSGTAATGEVTKEQLEGVGEIEYKPISAARDTLQFGSLPEYPEADLWIEELVQGGNRLLERG